jgi:glycosyltransferase involved in cell wall biosynthesis
MTSTDSPVRVMRIIARLNIGGPAIHVSLLTAGLNDAVFRSRLVTGVISASEGDMSDLAHQLKVDPVVIPWLGREISPFDDLRALFALIRLIRQERPHIVHTHTAKAGFLGRVAAFVCRVPIIVHTFHGHVFRGYFNPLKTRLFIWLERLAARLSSVILTVSEGLRDDLVAFRIAPPERIRVIPLGLPLADLAHLDSLRGMFRRELGCLTETPLIGIIGRLVPIKNHELFLMAAQCVLQAMPQAHFVIVGDGERRAELEGLVSQMGISDQVHFTGWRRDLPRIYADLDAVVISSHNEGTPVSLIEAMAAGVPVVSTAVGGVPDVLKDGELGTLVSPADAQALADAILEILKAGRGPRTEQAQNWVLERYDAARLVADMRALYLELLRCKGVQLADTMPQDVL